MFRLSPIRRRRVFALPLHLVDGAFALLLVLACVAGGKTALAGLPRFTATFFPPGMMAAQAHGEASTAIAHLTLRLAGSGVISRDPASQQVAGEAARARPAIAIVIDDLGEDLAGTDRAILLPPQVALAFLPFAEASHWLAPSAVKAGHQVLVHMPMESLSSKSAGPMTLTVDLSPAEISRRLDWAFARVPGFVGINNHEGSRFTSDASVLAPVVRALAARKVFFLDSRTVATSQVVAVAQRFGVPSAGRDIFLDDTVSAQEVALQLRALEARARENGVAIAIGHPHDVTLTALARWTQDIGRRGFDLVPVSEAITRKSEKTEPVALAAR